MQRVFRFVRQLAAVYFLAVIMLSVIYLVLPPVSTVMVASFVMGDGMRRHWVPLESISQNAIRAVLVSEDARFCEHYGIDWKAVDKAARHAERYRRAPRGASTITMQVAKNLFLWNGRSWLRKTLEAPIALWIDLVWPKKRILEVYLNIAQWGDGVFGIEEAAMRNYGRHARNLDSWQSALLASALPDPERRSARYPGPAMAGMAGTVSARAGGADTSCLRGRPYPSLF